MTKTFRYIDKKKVFISLDCYPKKWEYFFNLKLEYRFETCS